MGLSDDVSFSCCFWRFEIVVVVYVAARAIWIFCPMLETKIYMYTYLRDNTHLRCHDRWWLFRQETTRFATTTNISTSTNVVVVVVVVATDGTL